MAAGLSFPVCILAKSAKMVPVMLGQLARGGCSYTLRDYCIAAAFVGGTALLTLGEKDKQEGVSDDLAHDDNGSNSSNNGDYSNDTYAGLAFILVSLVMDGVTAGLQKRLKQDAVTSGKIPTPYDFLLYTNMSMAATALPIAVMSGDCVAGWAFCAANPAVRRMIGTCCVCSVVGQSFILYIVAHFDPLVCSTVAGGLEYCHQGAFSVRAGLVGSAGGRLGATTGSTGKIVLSISARQPPNSFERLSVISRVHVRPQSAYCNMDRGAI
jgi:UDP-galactose transporter B1